VHDEGLNDTQFLTIDPVTFGVVPLGSLHEGLDIEGLTINKKGELRGSSGDDAVDNPNLDGVLYSVDSSDGSVENMGNICFELEKNPVCHREVSALSYHPDGGLWGWAEECGLIEINVDEPEKSRLEFLHTDVAICTTSKPNLVSPIVEDITWDNAGEKIYFAEGNTVKVYVPKTGDISLVKGFGKNVEAIEALPNGKFLVGVHGASKLQVLSANGDVEPAKENVGKYNDIEAIACLYQCVEEELTKDWTYVTDFVKDTTGNNKLEIYGMALKQDGNTITVAVSANMSPDDPLYYDGKKKKVVSADDPNGENVNFSDFVFDFDGTKYAVHFAPDNDSDATELGLYENVTLKDVTKKNSGWATFKKYSEKRKKGSDLGDLLIKNNYFNWDTSRSVPQEIASGDKVANDHFTLLNEDELNTAGLDFANGLDNGTGTHTFGFSFTKTEDMAGEFISYIFTECLNDGVAMVNELPTCP
jgi:hypothetical protein